MSYIMANSNAKGQLIKFCVFFVVSLFFLMLIPESQSGGATPEWCRSIALYSLLLFVFQLWAYRWILKERAKPLPLVFLVILYIFNLSQIILHGFDLDQVEDISSSQFLVNASMVVDSVEVAITAIIGLFMGMTVVYSIKSKDFLKTETVTVKDYSTISLIVIFVIGFVADFICNVFVMITLGYTGDLESIPYLNIIRYFSFLLPSAVIGAFVKQSYSKTTKRNIFIAFVAYKFVCMMGGYRGFAMITILLIFYAYYKLSSHFKIKFHHIILGVIVLQLGSGLMVGIRDSRIEGVSMDTIFAAMFDLKNSAILSLLSEFGYSLDIINVVLSSMDNNSHHGLLNSILDIVPGISGLTGVGSEGSMDSVLGLRNLGGNVIADLLYGYGRSTMIVTSFIMGVIYAVFFEMFEKALEKRIPFVLAYSFPILVDFIFCARSSITKMPREIVWYFMLLYFLTIIFPRKKYIVKNVG